MRYLLEYFKVRLLPYIKKDLIETWKLSIVHQIYHHIGQTVQVIAPRSPIVHKLVGTREHQVAFEHVNLLWAAVPSCFRIAPPGDEAKVNKVQGEALEAILNIFRW